MLVTLMLPVNSFILIIIWRYQLDVKDNGKYDCFTFQICLYCSVGSVNDTVVCRKNYWIAEVCILYLSHFFSIVLEVSHIPNQILMYKIGNANWCWHHTFNCPPDSFIFPKFTVSVTAHNDV